MIEAPAGHGKSALLSEALRRAAGFRTLVGRGGEFERTAGFGVVRDLYGAVTLEPSSGVMAGAARLASPLIGDAPAASAPDDAALNHGLYWLTANLATQRPLLLVVDDAQWADAASLRYLEYLAARIDSLPCALALAWRPGEPASDESFVGRVLALSSSVRLAPEALSRDGSAALVLAQTSAALSDDLLDRCHDASAGNPFLLTELAGAISQRIAAGEEPFPRDWVAGGIAATAVGAAPERLQRIVRARLSRLPEPAAAVAEALAVLGPQAALRHAAAVAGVSRHEAASAADALAAADLIRPQARIDFVHPLIRRAIYDMQPAPSRAEAHAAAARALAAEQADSELVGGHLLAAPAAGDQAVVDQLIAAARIASERGAPGAAATYLRRALDEPPADAARAAVLRALGNAEARTGQPGAIAHLRHAHVRARDARERLDIALDIAHASTAYWPAGIDDVATELSAALAADEDAESESAMLARALLLYASVPTTSARWSEDAERARATYRTASDGIGRRVLGATLAFAALWANEPVGEVRALARYALEDDGTYEAALAAGWQLTWCCPILALTGDWDLAERRLTQALASGEQRGSPRAARNALWARTAVRSLRGNLAAAESDARQALQLHREPPWRSIIFLIFGSALVEVLIDRESPAAAQALLEQLELDGDLDSLPIAAQLLCTRSHLRLAQGRPEAALADSQAAREVLARADLNPVAMFSVEERAAAALAACGRHEQARAAAAQAVRLAHAHGAPGAIGTALRTVALLQRGPESVRQLTVALDLLASSGRALEHARTLIDLGAAMRRQGQRSAARGPLAEGRERAHRCGAHALEQRATQELRATGARPRRIMLSGAESLTASERRVAEMAADGLTSRTIAEQLFVTHKTIETHLSHIYRKLDIPGRQHIAEALGRQAPSQDSAVAAKDQGRSRMQAQQG